MTTTPDDRKATVLDSDDGAPVSGEAPLQPGTILSHFEILSVLGSGGMGVVYTARDTTLDRKVAIKVLRHDMVASETRRARLLREAQAMAKLRHPNVVTVHEAGESEGRVYIAMELVDGETLREWLRAHRPWREVVDRVVQAGRGLEAAHGEGLVHRDFKPENVIAGSDGRVRVGDFGVVGVSAGADAGPEETAPLTMTGALVGTPRYMSPEQLEGRPTDARADQFALAVVLYEGLYGTLPFAGAKLKELRENVLAGKVQPPPPRAPRWLEPIVRRGLSVDPAARYPSVGSMLADLEQGPLVTGRRVGAAVGAAVLVGLAAWGLLRGQGDPCGGAAAKLAGVWDDGVKAAVATAFLASGRSYGADTLRRVTATLDDYTRGWVATRTDACQATAVRREQSAELLDARMACFDRRLRALRALTRVFARGPDPEVVDRAIAASLALDPVDGCAAPGRRAPARTGEARALEQRLEDALAQVRAGKLGAAQEASQGLVAEARRLGDKALLVDALLLVGRVSPDKDPKGAAAAQEEAAALAGELDDDSAVARALLRLMRILGTNQQRRSDALALRPAVDAAVRRAKDERLLVNLHQATALTLYEDGRYAEAETSIKEAIAVTERVSGPQSLEMARALGDYTRILDGLGRNEEAEKLAQRAVAISEKVLGPDHVDLASQLNDLGIQEWRLRRYDQAARRFERVLAIHEANVGPGSPRVAASLTNLGLVYMDQGRSEEGLAMLQRALPIREKAYGPEHPAVAAALNNIGNAYLRLGRPGEALAAHERALAIREKTLPPTHPDLGLSVTNVGRAYSALGKADEAVAWQERAVAIHEKTFAGDHPATQQARLNLADAYIDAGRPGDAFPLLERLARGPSDAVARAYVDFANARALRAAGRDRPRAERLARGARDTLAAAGQAEREGLARVDAFLSQKP